jgi:hypothetical protein
MCIAWGFGRVNVLALQRMLGHKSAKTTLDTYSDLFDDDLDAVAVTLHARYSPESVPKVCPSGTHEGRQQAQTLPPLRCGRRDSNPIRLSPSAA